MRALPLLSFYLVTWTPRAAIQAVASSLRELTAGGGRTIKQFHKPASKGIPRTCAIKIMTQVRTVDQSGVPPMFIDFPFDNDVTYVTRSVS